MELYYQHITHGLLSKVRNLRTNKQFLQTENSVLKKLRTKQKREFKKVLTTAEICKNLQKEKNLWKSKLVVATNEHKHIAEQDR